MCYIVINQREILIFKITVEHGEVTTVLGAPVCEGAQILTLHKG